MPLSLPSTEDYNNPLFHTCPGVTHGQNRGQLVDGTLVAEAQQQEQRKYVDPNGIKFDIVNPLHARNSWRLSV